MKKLGIYLLFVTLCVVTTTARAQWTDMEWETYGLGFKAPSNFDLKQNDDKAFTAKGAIFTMSIKPWEDATITEPMKICQKAINRTPGTDKTVIEEADIEDLHGFTGYEAYFTAVQNGKLVHVVVGGYLDPESSVNFTVQLLFWDKTEAENNKNYKAALYILKSFHKLK